MYTYTISFILLSIFLSSSVLASPNYNDLKSRCEILKAEGRWHWDCSVPAIDKPMANILSNPDHDCGCAGRVLKHLSTGLYRCEIHKPTCGDVSFQKTLGYNPNLNWYNEEQAVSGSSEQNMQIQFTDIVHQQQRDFSRLPIKKAPAIGSNAAGFYYSLSPTSHRISLVTYDGRSPITIPLEQVNFDQVIMLECGPSTGFIPREGYVNHQTILGTTGYETNTSTCHIARNLEYKWFWGGQLGVNTWYSRNENGDIQCLSNNAQECLWIDSPLSQYQISTNSALRALENSADTLKSHINQYDEVLLKTSDGHWVGNISLPTNVDNGKIVKLVVDSSFGVNIKYAGKTQHVAKGETYAARYIHGHWIALDSNINAEIELVATALPLVCGNQHKATHGISGYANPMHWCARLLAPFQELQKHNLQEVMDSKQAHIDRLFDQMEYWKLKKIDVDNNYIARLDSLRKQADTKDKEATAACAFAWTLWGAIPCGILTTEYNDLVDERKALSDERTAKLNAARIQVAEGRNTQFHLLHEQWAQSDDTHFSALLKEESQSLAELKALKEGYNKTADEKHKEYLAAVQKYMDDTDPANILLNGLEDLPLVGPEIRNIVNYAENPSGKNLRHMLLGLAGPAGETVEGVVELTTGESGLNSNELNFLSDVLNDLGKDDSLGEAMEDIVSDAINDMGDQAIESIRQAGLWTDNPSDDAPLEINYAGIVDLRARSARYEYDPWRDTHAQAVQFQKNLTPKNPNYLNYIRNPNSYNTNSLTDIEYAAGGAAFNHRIASIFAHSMGKNYMDVARQNPSYQNWSDTQINHELYKLLADAAYYEQRIPHWVDSSVIGQRPAALIYDNDHALLVLNSDFVQAHDEDYSKFYFEELGHWLNWWRCKVFDVAVGKCEVHGDAGARFRDAVFVDPSLHQGSYEALLAELPAHKEVDNVAIKFSNNKIGRLEGWPNYYTMNDHIISNGSFNWLMRLGLDVTSEYSFVSDEFDMEVSISAPSPTMKGNPWKTSANGYCKTDTQTDCNMPTMWITVSFRDAIKLSVAKLPKVKDSKFAQSGADISPRLVRKHGGKLPFQLTSVDGTNWDYKSFHNIYYKKFTAAIEAKLDLWKSGHAAAGKSSSKVHKPEFSLKSSPAEGSYLVEIATRDTADFAGWLAGDITSAVAGCAAGFAIGVVAEQDPVLLCHGFSDLTEIVETAFQGLDKKPTMLFEADGNVTLPISLEYKYATSGNKIKGAFKGSSTVPSQPGRVQYDRQDMQEAYPGFSGAAPETAEVSSFKTKAGKAFKKLGARSISPIAVFRFRVGFNYSETIMQEGEYALPSAVVSD